MPAFDGGDDFVRVRGPCEGLARGLIEANDIADSYGLDRKAYRAGLRNQAKSDLRLSSHARNAPWRAFVGSDAYRAMIEVAERMAGY